MDRGGRGGLQVLSHHLNTDFQVFSLDDVDLAFERITCLKYQQNASLSGVLPCLSFPSLLDHPSSQAAHSCDTLNTFARRLEHFCVTTCDTFNTFV